MESYLKLISKIINEGKLQPNRTGIDALVISGYLFEHNMSEGFPLLTTKKMAWNSIKVELEGFIKGITDKKWYQDRGCHIWDEWCNPEKVSYGHDEGTKKKMKEERDLGPIYGFQWRHFGADYGKYSEDSKKDELECLKMKKRIPAYEINYEGRGKDQLKDLLEKLKKNPYDRRMKVSAWNPVDIPKMALAPCHYCFSCIVLEDKLDLIWNQRSVDSMLGLPFNIASYALLLHLIAQESGLKEGKLIGFLENVHIYKNHIGNALEQLKRKPLKLPSIESNFNSIFDWEHHQSKLLNYKHHPKLNFEIAV